MTRLGRRALLSTLAPIAAALVGCAEPGPEAPFWYSYGGKPREVLLRLIARFHDAQSEHRIKPVYQGDYFETLAKLRTAIHASMAPALTHVVGESIPYLVEAGVLERLDRVSELEGDLGLLPTLDEASMFTGKPEGVHALPFNRSTPIAYLNRAMFEEAGLTAPTSWAELRETARALTRGEGGDRRFGFACAIDWWFWVALVEQAGGSVFDSFGHATLGEDAGVEALELWRELLAADVMRPPPGRDYNAWQVVNGDFLEQRAAMIWTSTAYVRYFDDNAKFDFVTARLPAKVMHAVPSGGTFFVMPKGAREDHQRAAAAFLAFMMRPENANEFATETGYIPVSKLGLRALEADGYYERRPNDRVAVDQLSDVQSWPWTTKLLRVQREIVQPRLEEAILGGRPSRAVLEEARDDARTDR